MTRWTRRLLIGAVAVLVPALAGCEAGLDAPTLAYHPASSGVSTVRSGISISNLFVLGPALNAVLPVGGQAGVFVALNARSQDQLVSVSAPGTAASATLTGGPVTLNPLTTVDLSRPQPVIVLTGLTKPLSGGQTIQLVLNFANAGPVSLQVPVEPQAFDYATFSPPATPTPSPSHKPTPTPSPSHKP